ncbi:hypothetical protein ACFLSA_01275 [Bacteroidota bacterium]
MKKLFIVLLFTIQNFVIFTQEQTDKPEKKTFQTSFIYPIGTDGVNSKDYSYELSFNVLAGYTGGLDGFELGGIANGVLGDVNGFQLAGIANMVKGKIDGLQVAGFANITSNKANALQIGGFANLHTSKFEGLQLSGFGNIIGGKAEGLQIAGFGNIVGSKMEGIQLAGFGNVATNLEGIQISGFLNIAEKLEGVQLGVLNICDSIEGIPIGVLSIAKNGYRTADSWASLTLHTNMAYKIGVEKFYNIFSFGVNYVSGMNWGLGYGIGTQFILNEKSRVFIEVIDYDMNQSADWWNDYVNLYHVRFNFSNIVDQNIRVYFGPTYNLLVSERNTKSLRIADDITPYSFFNRNSANYNVRMWIGINAGILF